MVESVNCCISFTCITILLALAVAGPSRLLFGTDSSFFPRGWQNGVYDAQQQIVDRLGISTADAALIFGGNFDRLFP